jgi:hypothetical protein
MKLESDNYNHNLEQYEFECMQCLGLNLISKEVNLNENKYMHIVKCEYCSMIYKLI